MANKENTKGKAWWDFRKSSNEEPAQKVYSFNTTSTFNDVKYDYSKPYINTTANGQYIPFGPDNLYPYVLLDMFHTSPFHASIIEFKLRSIMAGGLEVTVNDKNKVEGIIRKGLVEKMFNNTFLTRFIQDYLIHARNVIKITNNKKVEIVGAEKVRTGSDNYDVDFVVSEDWRKRRGDVKEYSQWSKYNKDKEQMNVFQILTPGIAVYSIPSYSSAGNWIWLDGQISLFQKQNIENSINPSAIFNFYQNPGNKEEKEKFIQDLQLSFSSARNAGKILTFFSDSKESAPDIKIADANKLDKAFAAVQENIIRNVAYSHTLNPMLMGIVTAGSLGNTEELNTSFKIFNNIYLEPTQDLIESYLNEILEMVGYSNVSVQFKRKDTYIN